MTSHLCQYARGHGAHTLKLKSSALELDSVVVVASAMRVMSLFLAASMTPWTVGTVVVRLSVATLTWATLLT